MRTATLPVGLAAFMTVGRLTGCQQVRLGHRGLAVREGANHRHLDHGHGEPSYRDYKVGSPEVRQRGEYVVPEGVVQARAGGTLPVRLQLVPLGGGAARTLS